MEHQNTQHPGQPNYLGPQEGWFLFIHHNIILEYSDDIQQRVEYILRVKPKHEQKTRLKALTHVPNRYVANQVQTARQIYDKALLAYNSALHVKNMQECYNALLAYNKALQDSYESLQTYDTAWLQNHFPLQYKMWDAANCSLIYKENTCIS